MNCVNFSFSSNLSSFANGEEEAAKPKIKIMEKISGEDGNVLSNVGNLVKGSVGNVLGKGLGGLGGLGKLGGGSWF